VVLTGLTGVGQWTRGLVFCCVLGSEGCVLVPRSSGTPVATWAWPTWVVSYGPPWAHYLGAYQDRLLGGPLGLLGLRYTAPEGVEHKDTQE
jgi:hypothetical protein